MDDSHLKDACPACGLPKTVFEPYTKKISPRRKFLLDQHIHPVAVHFPQVLMLLCIVMPLLSIMFSDPLRLEFLAIAKWSILALPWTVLLGFVTGLLDGKLRFKKVTTPLLKNKMIAGIIFQLLSIIACTLYLLNGLTLPTIWLIVVINVLSTPLAIYLGKAGSSMFDSIIPG
jgi:uncharacterized membrane protein